MASDNVASDVARGVASDVARGVVMTRGTQTTDDVGWLCSILRSRVGMSCLAISQESYFLVEVNGETGSLEAREVGNRYPILSPEIHAVETVRRLFHRKLRFAIKLKGHRKELYICNACMNGWWPALQVGAMCWETPPPDTSGQSLPTHLIGSRSTPKVP
jgi:hypothetical protein